jgi:hypothetical protein
MPARSQRARVNPSSRTATWSPPRDEPRDCVSRPGNLWAWDPETFMRSERQSWSGPVGPLLCYAAVEYLSGRFLGWLT